MPAGEFAWRPEFRQRIRALRQTVEQRPRHVAAKFGARLDEPSHIREVLLTLPGAALWIFSSPSLPAQYVFYRCNPHRVPST